MSHYVSKYRNAPYYTIFYNSPTLSIYRDLVLVIKIYRNGPYMCCVCRKLQSNKLFNSNGVRKMVPQLNVQLRCYYQLMNISMLLLLFLLLKIHNDTHTHQQIEIVHVGQT